MPPSPTTTAPRGDELVMKILRTAANFFLFINFCSLEESFLCTGLENCSSPPHYFITTKFPLNCIRDCTAKTPKKTGEFLINLTRLFAALLEISSLCCGCCPLWNFRFHALLSCCRSSSEESNFLGTILCADTTNFLIKKFSPEFRSLLKTMMLDGTKGRASERERERDNDKAIYLKCCNAKVVFN
jgi:hypothetical protein